MGYPALLREEPAGGFLGTALFVLIVAGISLALAAAGLVDLRAAAEHFDWGILVIFVSLDMLTKLFISTGATEGAAMQIVRWSRGKHAALILLFSAFLFVVSSLVNNITAVEVILPVVFIALCGVALTRTYFTLFFSLLLATSNLGGAATPIGDFPAIVILKSGITSFSGYLVRAFPLFAVTAIILTLVYILLVRWQLRRDNVRPDDLSYNVTRCLMHVRYKHFLIDWPFLGALLGVLLLMFVAWALLPPGKFTPEFVAVTGLVLGLIVTAALKRRDALADFNTLFDLKPVFLIGAFLFGAAVVASSGLVEWVAGLLTDHFTEPRSLLVATMVATALLTGVCSAGPTAAAMMPVIKRLATEGALAGQGDLLAIGFAAAICAGSSLFLWSATAGFVLSEKCDVASLTTATGETARWGIRQYLGYGALNFAVQLSIGIIWVLVAVG